VGKLLEETDVSFKDIDYKLVGKFLAVHLSPEEIARNNLISVIPKRKKSGTGGPKPEMAYLDSDVEKVGYDKWDWNGKRKIHSEIQKKKMVASMMEVGVHAILSNHLYQFDGKVFKHQKGGPIGLEITGVLARLVMLPWDRDFIDKLRRLEIDLLMYLRYVDDGNLSLEAVEPGLRFKDGKLSILQEDVETDRDIPADKRTANFIKTVA
jgi:hypothetical protein